MGSRSLAIIHCEPSIPWQPKRAAYFAEGFRRIGLKVEITADRFRHDEGFPVLLGTSMWRGIERDGWGEFLLVDRCSFGDTEKFVSLVWNGHGRRGDHRVPENFDASRWEKHGVELKPWHDGERRILCGQTESYSPHWPSLEDWYQQSLGKATHFRRHPAGINPTALPDASTFEDCGLAITLNSSVGAQCVLSGIATIANDEGSMAYEMSGHFNHLTRDAARDKWCHWLAWTQWSDDEIREGTPWEYLL